MGWPVSGLLDAPSGAIAAGRGKTAARDRRRSKRPLLISKRSYRADRRPIFRVSFMYMQLKNNHLPINPIILAARHHPVEPRGVLSPDELRRIVADMVD
jgi:hypothetical protein